MATDGKEKKEYDFVELGRQGAYARALSLTPRRRKEIARKAAQTRWSRVADASA